MAWAVMDLIIAGAPNEAASQVEPVLGPLALPEADSARCQTAGVQTAGPRLYALVATRAPVAAVFRRGPSEWWHIGRWDLATGDCEPGARLHGRIYPRRSDLSPDGTLLLAFIMGRTGPGFLEPDPPAWPDTYVSLSKLPWLTALAAWREGTNGRAVAGASTNA